MTKQTLRLVFACCILLWVSNSTFIYAQEAFPPYTKVGTLPNGMRYILLPTQQTPACAEVRLVMTVGSVNEQIPSQAGAAHFIEHMAFKGTKKYPNRSIISYFEKCGLRYGRDINALTGYDRTQYMLTIPTHLPNENIIDSTLNTVEQWICGLTLDETDIEKERNIILEELRNYQFNDPFHKLKIGIGAEAHHIPLGREYDIRHITPKALQQFYKQWYTPQHATLIIVGDINVHQVEKSIRTILSPIDKGKPSKHNFILPLHYNKGITINSTTDSYTPHPIIELIVPLPASLPNSTSTHAQNANCKILINLIESYFNGKGLKYSVSKDWYLMGTDHLVFSLFALTESGIIDAVQRLATVLTNLAKHGFRKSDIEKAKEQVLKSYGVIPPSYTLKGWCDYFTDYVILGYLPIIRSNSFIALRNDLRKTTSTTLQDLLTVWLNKAKQNMLVAYIKPPGINTTITAQQILTAWNEGCNSSSDSFSLPILYAEPQNIDSTHIQWQTPKLLLTPIRNSYSAKIKNQYWLKNIGVKVVNLTNGIKLLLHPYKSTSSEPANLYFTLIGKGGLLQLPKLQQALYEGAAGYMELGGIDGIESDSLSDYMVHKNISMSSDISLQWHEVYASAPPTESAELFRLVYHKLHNPERCYREFEQVKNNEIQSIGSESLLSHMIANSYSDNNRLFIDSLLGNRLDISQHVAQYAVKARNLDSIATFYTRTFSEPTNKTILVTGCFDINKVIEQLIETFGKTPQKQKTTFEGYVNPLPSKNTILRTYTNGDTQQTTINYLAVGTVQASLLSSLHLKLITNYLQNKLIDILREKLHLVYSPYVQLHMISSHNTIKYAINLCASCKDKNQQTVIDEVRHIIANTKNISISRAELNALIRSFIITKQQTLTPEADIEWRNAIIDLIKLDITVDEFDKYESILQSITPSDFSKACKALI